MDSIKNAANSASETIKEGVSGASKQGNKEVAKDSNQSAGTRLGAAKDAVGDKIDETKHSTSADAHKEAAKQ